MNITVVFQLPRELKIGGALPLGLLEGATKWCRDASLLASAFPQLLCLPSRWYKLAGGGQGVGLVSFRPFFTWEEHPSPSARPTDASQPLRVFHSGSNPNPPSCLPLGCRVPRVGFVQLCVTPERRTCPPAAGQLELGLGQELSSETLGC